MPVQSIGANTANAEPEAAAGELCLVPPASSLEAFGSGLQVVCRMYSTFGAVELQWVLSQWPWLSGQRLPLCLQSHPPQEPWFHLVHPEQSCSNQLLVFQYRRAFFCLEETLQGSIPHLSCHVLAASRDGVNNDPYNEQHHTSPRASSFQWWS